MKVKEAIELLSKLDKEEELFMFFKSPDGKLQFSSDISGISQGAVCDEYGKLIKGVLISKEIEPVYIDTSKKNCR